ncbi:hypothetical protein Mth01_48960 [Sphaerimonospora thailandensis]|uniref:Uncharacterized protein n=2 Tax=Sphaerimonospora thailandensis TaxID=795644 RepID=A0A8J3RHV8_9ACTN|nr:hypothetical protein Mth01_48960 [Sphaerimonospora thailandensis]
MSIEFIRNNPMTAVELLRDAAGIQPPPFATAALEALDFTQVAPVEFRADSVVVLRNQKGEARFATIVEAQENYDTGKRYSWPVYVTALRARLKCATALVVICHDAAVGRWSEQPITLGPSGIITPLVIHPGRIPLITDPDRARASPELAVLSTILNAKTSEIEPAALQAMLAGLNTLEAEQAELYLHYVLDKLPDVAQKHMKELMTMNNDLLKRAKDLARPYVTDWIDQGRQEGLAEGEAKAILTVLDARGMEISPETRDRITRCNDLDLLTTWVRRAATVNSADEIFT